MSKQKSAYFLITVSFVMGMVATTSISGCDSGKKESASTTAPKSSLDGEGTSQIQLDKPVDAAGASASQPEATDSTPSEPASAAQEPPAPEAGASEPPAASGN